METWRDNYYNMEDITRDLRDNALDQIATIAHGIGNDAEEKVNRIIGVIDLLSFVERKMKGDAVDDAT